MSGGVKGLTKVSEMDEHEGQDGVGGICCVLRLLDVGVHTADVCLSKVMDSWW